MAPIDFEEELNPEQQRVVLSGEGPVLVIAGAGSGKTRTLTYRVARLIQTGISPGRVLLATFTNKAARQMLSRVEGLTGIDISRLWGGTFHHIANLILRRYGNFLQYDRNYSIMDGEDSRQLLNTCTAEMGVDTRTERFPRGDVLGDIISFSVNTGESIEKVVIRKYPFFLGRLEDIQSISSRYRVRKQELNMMDFDDLLANLRRLFREYPRVLEEYSEKFHHVLVDEYQDTNALQADILDLLAQRHRNIMVVGDDSQSIYSFRGANFENIIRFPERYPDAKIYKLETNYRSTPEILRLANLSILNNRDQFQKKLKAVKKRGSRPILAPARNSAQQANFVSQRILDFYMEGIPLNEIAVLYRAHYHSMELQMEMTRRGIPFEIRSGMRFFEQAHVKDITAFLRVVVNPFDEIAWKRTLMLYEKVGKATAQKIWKQVSSHENPLVFLSSDAFLKCVPKSSSQGLLRFRDTVLDLVGVIGEKKPTEIIELILDSGYRDFLRKEYVDGVSREDDLHQLARFSAKYSTVDELLTELALLTSASEAEDSTAAESRDNRVVLSSIHQSKGLEWSVVFIIWCCEGMMPLSRALEEEGGEEEERRLFYVAATRAKDLLYLCYPMIDYGKGTGYTFCRPSRFIEELEPSNSDPAERPFEQWVLDDL